MAVARQSKQHFPGICAYRSRSVSVQDRLSVKLYRLNMLLHSNPLINHMSIISSLFSHQTKPIYIRYQIPIEFVSMFPSPLLQRREYAQQQTNIREHEIHREDSMKRIDVSCPIEQLALCLTTYWQQMNDWLQNC
jgi:hypothetical protein